MGSVKRSALTVRLLPRERPGLTGQLVAEVKGPDCLKLSPCTDSQTPAPGVGRGEVWSKALGCSASWQDRDLPEAAPWMQQAGEGPCWEQHLGVPPKRTPMAVLSPASSLVARFRAECTGRVFPSGGSWSSDPGFLAQV